MESSREKRRNTLYKAIAVTLTLIFHVALFGGIYYAMDTGSDDIEMVEDKKDPAKKKTMART